MRCDSQKLRLFFIAAWQDIFDCLRGFFMVYTQTLEQMKKSATSNKSGATHIANVASFDSGFSLSTVMLSGAGIISLVGIVMVSGGLVD
jgi:hypothetical protein